MYIGEVSFLAPPRIMNGSENKYENHLLHMVSGRAFVDQVSLIFRYNYFMTRRVKPQTRRNNIFGNQ